MGIKIQYVPSIFSGSTDISMSDAHFMMVPDYVPDETTAFGLFQKNDFYKTFKASSTYKKYINLKKFWASRDIAWTDVGTVRPDAGAAIRLYTNGFANGSQLARVNVTYYIAFRGNV